MFRFKNVLFLLSFLFLTATSFAEQPAFVKEFLGQMDYVEGKLTQLAEAMPEDTYGWRPMEGVRSVGEVYLHVAFGNYLWITLGGGKVPEDVGFVADFSKRNEWDTQTTDKMKIIDIMKKSFSAMKDFAKNLTEEDLNKEIEFFGMKSSVRNFLVSGIGHLHEHLGQSIAYARMNKVVPPWSKDEG
jgi:uncharacterized damage-inducible protein DinB